MQGLQAGEAPQTNIVLFHTTSPFFKALSLWICDRTSLRYFQWHSYIILGKKLVLNRSPRSFKKGDMQRKVCLLSGHGPPKKICRMIYKLVGNFKVHICGI